MLTVRNTRSKSGELILSAMIMFVDFGATPFRGFRWSLLDAKIGKVFNITWATVVRKISVECAEAKV